MATGYAAPRKVSFRPRDLRRTLAADQRDPVLKAGLAQRLDAPDRQEVLAGEDGAWRVGKGDFSVRVTDPEHDQL